MPIAPIFNFLSWPSKGFYFRDALLERVYCPKCEKTIKKERIKQVNQELKDRFNMDSLEKGQCPVCGTGLLDPEAKRRHKNEA
jgi:ssDNA-binding Zn-finger/Zn-ribbon topoisomerase 1